MMNRNNNHSVCPVELAIGLDNPFRRLIQNPLKILKPYITEGMTVLDLGCGPGFFTVAIAKLLRSSGKVIAADLQEGMLKKLKKKIEGTELEQRIELHKCEVDTIGIAEKVDFILALYVIHEIPDQDRLFVEFKSILKPKGRILIIEPNFHVRKKAFEKMEKRLTHNGFKIKARPELFLSRTLLLESLV